MQGVSEGRHVGLDSDSKNSPLGIPSEASGSSVSAIAGPSKATSFFTPASKKSPLQKVHWLQPLGSEGSCWLGTYGDPFKLPLEQINASQSSSSSSQSLKTYQKIAAFDLDGTLIQTHSGSQAWAFKDKFDWKIWGGSSDEQTVLAKVKAEAQQGTLIVLVTNQKNLDTKKSKSKEFTTKAEEWKARLNLILQRLDVACIVVVALRDDQYRKPRAGWTSELRRMWEKAGSGAEAIGLEMELDEEKRKGLKEEERSFFVGDAAGRHGDFADTDRKMAINIQWDFWTPEEYFLGELPAKFTLTGYRPGALRVPHTPQDARQDPQSPPTVLSALQSRLLDKSAAPCLLILVGPQASGKSFFAKRLADSSNGQWVRVNQDLLKTREKCIKTTDEALQAGKSVVIDNTNPARATRALYTDLAKKHGVREVLCLHFDLSLEEAVHNDAYRSKRWLFEDKSRPQDLPKPMPGIAFASFFKSLEEPNASQEGFKEVITVKFEFDGATTAAGAGAMPSRAQNGDQLNQRAWSKWYH